MEQRSIAMPILTDYEQKREPLSATRASRLKPLWKQRLVVATLVFSDVLLAFLVWGVAYLFHGVWGRGSSRRLPLPPSRPAWRCGWGCALCWGCTQVMA